MNRRGLVSLATAAATVAALALVPGAGSRGGWTLRFAFVPQRAYQGRPAALSVLVRSPKARCTLAEVYEASEAEMQAQVEALAWHLVRAWGAPSWEAARKVAEDELRHTAEVCETLAPESWITVKREPRSGGDEVGEEYSVYDRLLVGAHRL